MTALLVGLLTLQSFYFFQWGLSPFPLLGSAVIISREIWISRKALPSLIGERPSWHLFAWVAILAISTAIGVHNAQSMSPLKTFIGMMIGVSTFWAVKRDAGAYRHAIPVVLWIHVAAWTAQFLSYYLFSKHFLYFITPLTGEEQRIMFGAGATGYPGDHTIRPAGLYNEPTNYAVFGILLLIAYFDSLVRPSRSDWVLLTVFSATALLSSTVLGVFGVFVLILYLYFSRPGFRTAALGSLLAAHLTILSLPFRHTLYIHAWVRAANIPYSRIVGQPLIDDTSADQRVSPPHSIPLALVPESRGITGEGLGNYSVFGGASSGFAYLLKFLGPVLTAIFLITLVASNRTWGMCATLLLVLINAPLIQYPFVWFIWGLLKPNARVPKPYAPT